MASDEMSFEIVDDGRLYKIILHYLISSREPLGSLVSLYNSHGPSSVRRPMSVVRPSTIFKALLLQNRWANRSQISYGASVGWGNENLFAGSGSLDQDGRHAHIW